MDKYHFDEIVERHHTHSYKYDSADAKGTEIGLWVADMDFRVAPEISEAVRNRANHDVYGYVTVSNDYKKAVRNWYATEHNWQIPTEQIEAIPGVVPAITALLRERAKEGAMCFNTPAYNCFFSSARHAECAAIESPLINKDGHFEMDIEGMRKALSQAKTYLLCNPHNPTGRVWSAEELMTVARICAENNVMVIADEIHCEFAWGAPYTPFARIAEQLKAEGKNIHYIILNSASKAWNIAGLRQANAIAGDEESLNILRMALEENELEDMNIFGVEATIAAYRHGKEWLKEVNAYIQSNYQLLRQWCNENLPQLIVTKQEGTYLAWVDCRAINNTTEKITHRILSETGVKVNDGKMYGGDGFIRINLAISRDRLREALNLMLPILIDEFHR